MRDQGTDVRRLVVESREPITGDLVTDVLGRTGTPILTDHPTDPHMQRALFLWHDTDPATRGVYLWANRLTDKQHVDAGLMRRRPGSDLWYVELTVPRDIMTGYRLLPLTTTTPGVTADGRVVYSRELLRDAQIDPHNTVLRHTPCFGSVLAGSDAPVLSTWSARPGASIILDERTPTGVRYRLAAADRPDPRGRADLLVMFDADKWFDRLHAPAVLAADSRFGRPIAVLGIDSPPSPAERMAFLGASDTVLDTIADIVIPTATDALTRRPERVVVAGQSLGGIASIALACRRPDLVDEVLAYSVSMWWRPGMTSRPSQTPDGDTWIAGRVREVTTPLTLRLAVGGFEDQLVGPMVDLATAARAAGHTSSVEIYSGGHDDASWAVMLLDHLVASAPD